MIRSITLMVVAGGLLLGAGCAFAAPSMISTKLPAVKKSKQGICIAPGKTGYATMTSYATFATMADCLKSGGTLPRK